MDSREKLQVLLEELLGSKSVYYQPPSSVKMKYPAIVYTRDDFKNSFANDSVYAQAQSYEVTVIDNDPDSEIVYKLSQLVACRFNRHFESENLNHDVFTLFF